MLRKLKKAISMVYDSRSKRLIIVFKIFKN